MLSRLVIVLACLGSVAHAATPEPLTLDVLESDRLVLVSRPNGVEARLQIDSGRAETLQLSLLNPRGGAGRAQTITVAPGAPVSVVLARPGSSTPDADLRLLVETVGQRPAKAWIAVVGAFYQAPRIYTLGDSTLRPNTSYAPRIVVRSYTSGCRMQPCETGLAGANVDVALLAVDDKGKTKSIGIGASATSDASGSVPVSLALGDLPNGKYRMTIAARHADGDASSSFELTVAREAKVLLSTDKPIYQPGQKVHLRLLVRESGSGHAAGNAAVTLAVYDAKNNKIFQKKGSSSKEGVYATELAIASMVNTGRWRIEALVDGQKTERTIDVKPYVLPKFKVELTTERGSYKPGELVKGTISGRYFFGEPLRKAKVRLTAESFDVSANELVRLDLTLDDAGMKSFELRLPDALVGLPMTNGAAPVRIVASVTDTAGQSNEGTKTLSVYQQPLQIVALAEAGQLVPNIENAVFFVVTSPDGAPAENAKLRIVAPNLDRTITSDASGIAELRFVPSGQTVVSVEAKAADGATATTSLALGMGDKRVLLRPNNPAPKGGEQVSFDVYVTSAVPYAFIDLVKEGQTIVTLSGPVVNGKASISTTLPPELTGTVLAHAYVIGNGLEFWSDTRPLVVRMADELQIDVSADKKRWLPGEEATLNIKVTDKNGHPVLAALGLWAVDEAVFALSELRPGMEQVFFLLEQEIMRPKVEIHAFEPEAVFIFEPRDKSPERDPLAMNRAARVLSAAAMPSFQHAVKLDSQSDRGAASASMWAAEMQRRARPWKAALKAWVQDHWRAPRGKDVHRALATAGLRPGKTRDPFGVLYVVSTDDSDYEVSDVEIASAGPDARFGTADDLSVNLEIGTTLDKVWQWQARLERQRWAEGRGNGMFFGVGDGAVAMPQVRMGAVGGMGFRGEGMGGGGMDFAADAPRPSAVAREPNAPKVVVTSNRITINDSGTTEGAGAPPPRIRDYFPETLLVEPLLLTDADGKAKLTFPMADSITTWRLSALASSSDGRLGSMSRGLEVFQDFFVDIAFPVSLTRGDQVTVPVAVYNYLPTAQTVKLGLQAEGGLEVQGDKNLEVTLAAGEVKGVQVPLVATSVGMGRLTVMARGSQMSDAVRREVKVDPDGFANTWSESGMLNERVKLSMSVPEDAIANASTLQVKLYPGMFAQVVDGLESMLRMPSGCFEQTSSSTFPNILVLKYLRDSKKSKPELEATALTYLAAGWQRLVTYEVKGGGFSWFGEAPANQVLTAYGIMEFHDMNKVYPIDQAVITRTRQWLANQQKADGSWVPDQAFLHQESWGDMQKSGLLVSAYITWSLAQSRPDRKRLDQPLANGLSYLRKNADKGDDAYVLSYLGNAMAEALADRNDGDERAAMRKVLDRLAALAVRDGDKVHFPTKQRTATYGSGESANIEVTALALRAFMRAGEHLDLVKPGLAWLIDRKGALGEWHTTQATVQVLQAMIASLSAAQDPISGQVAVLVNGEQVATAAYTADDFDVVRFIDASKSLKVGDNTIELVPSNGMKAMFQTTGTSYSPWKGWDPKQGEASAFDVDVKYDKSTLAKDDVVGVTVTVKSNLPGVASMGLVDVAVPPGFDVLSEDLEAAVADKTLQRFSLAGRQIILYVEELKPDQPFKLHFRVRARFPVKVSTGSTRVYEYYNPANAGVAVPGAIVVK